MYILRVFCVCHVLSHNNYDLLATFLTFLFDDFEHHIKLPVTDFKCL